MNSTSFWYKKKGCAVAGLLQGNHGAKGLLLLQLLQLLLLQRLLPVESHSLLASLRPHCTSCDEAIELPVAKPALKPTVCHMLRGREA